MQLNISKFNQFVTAAFLFLIFSFTVNADGLCINPSPSKESIVIFVNGITNDEGASLSSTELLRRKLDASEICNIDNNCTVDNFWNKTDGPIDDVQELHFVNSIERETANFALVSLLSYISTGYINYKNTLHSDVNLDNQLAMDKLVLDEMSALRERIENDTDIEFFESAGSQITSWLISYIKLRINIKAVNQGTKKIENNSNSLLLHHMENLQQVYDDRFKETYTARFNDLFMSKQDYYLDRASAADAITETVDELVVKLIEHLVSGKRIVIVAHSQGNHIIELAHSILSKRLEGTTALDTIQVVGVASVASTTPNNSYITWNADKIVLLAQDVINGDPLKPNFSSTTDYQEGNNHSFEKVYLNPDLKGYFTPEGYNLSELDEFLANNVEHSINDVVASLVGRALNKAKVRTFTTNFTSSLPEGQSKTTKSRIFNATGSGHTDDPIESYVWNWGDGSTNLTSNSPVTSYEYAEYGTYQVTFSYTTECGISDSITKEIEVGFRPDTPSNFSATRDGDSVEFNWNQVEGADRYKLYLSEQLFEGSVELAEGVDQYSVTGTTLTLPALDKGKVYYAVVVAFQNENRSVPTDVYTVELQDVIPETLSIPATLSHEEGKNKFVPFTFTPIELKDKVDHVSCTTNPDIGSLFGTPSIQGVSFTAPAVDDVTSFIIKCVAYAEPKVLFEPDEPLVVSNNLIVTVTKAEVTNTPPIARITTNKSLPTITEGDLFSLKGDTSTDPDGSIIRYSWKENGLEIGTSAILPLPLPSKTLVTGTTRTISLTVTDNGANGGLTDTTEVTFTVKEKENTPDDVTVELGSNISIQELIELDPPVSIATTGLKITDTLVCSSNPTGINVSNTKKTLNITAPSYIEGQANTFMVTCVARGLRDGSNKLLAQDSLTVTVTKEVTPEEVTVELGSNISIQELTELDPPVSIATTGLKITDTLVCSSNPTGINVSNTKKTLNITAPSYIEGQTNTFVVTCVARGLRDGSNKLLAQDSLTVTVTKAEATNNPPVASINGTPNTVRLLITVNEGEEVSLNASSSTDPDSDALTYKWSEAGTVFDETISFSKVFDVGVHIVTLQVSDGTEISEAKARIQVNEQADGKPDLVITSLNTTLGSDNNISIEYTVKNIGTGAAFLSDLYNVQGYLSLDETLSNDDFAFFGTYHPSGELLPGNSISLSIDNITNILSMGQFIILKVDASDVIDESDETNNTFTHRFSNDTGLSDCINATLGIPASEIPTQTQLESIKTLECVNKGIVNISSISSLINLEKLDLSINLVEDLSALSNLNHLWRLFLAANRVTDISPLASVSALKTLNLQDNNVNDFSAVSHLSLLGLVLDGNNLVDSNISSLSSGFSRLVHLSLARNQITDISVLLNFSGSNLQQLLLNDNYITDLSPLSSHVRLDLLDISNNCITDFSTLPTSITDLRGSDNQRSCVNALDLSAIGSPSDALSSPNGEEQWTYGTTKTIDWDTALITGSTVSLYVLDDDPSGLTQYSSSSELLSAKNWYKFGDSIPNNGSYSVDPADLHGTGDAYVVLIISDQHTDKWDVSDGLFTLSP